MFILKFLSIVFRYKKDKYRWMGRTQTIKIF